MPSKLEELILYIAHKSHDDAHFGATKLNKILFFADFYAFGYWGKSISGATYIHRQHGPAPKQVMSAVDALIMGGRALMEERPFLGYTQKRLVPLSNPNLSLFTPEEIQLVTDVIATMSGTTARGVSDLTHNLRPWIDTAMDEEIPYHTVFILTDTPVTLDDKLWAQAKLKEIVPPGV